MRAHKSWQNRGATALSERGGTLYNDDDEDDDDDDGGGPRRNPG